MTLPSKDRAGDYSDDWSGEFRIVSYNFGEDMTASLHRTKSANRLPSATTRTGLGYAGRWRDSEGAAQQMWPRKASRPSDRPLAAVLDREHRFPYERISWTFAELGLMGMTTPPECEGGGPDAISYAVVIEELTCVDSSIAITVAGHHSLGTLGHTNSSLSTRLSACDGLARGSRGQAKTG